LSDRIGIRGRIVSLYVRFRDSLGNAVYADTTPTVEITNSEGTIVRTLSNTSVSVDSDTDGVYYIDYNIPLNMVDGYAEDRWVAKIGDETVTSTFQFLVQEAGAVEASTEPDFVPGADVEFEWTKVEVEGINYLLKILKSRLKSSGTAQTSDGAGGFIETECNVFSDDELICFLVNGLSEFNQYPHFTGYTFADDAITGIFADIIVQGAVLVALAAQALIEKGREFTITDNGLSYQPPMISEILQSQYTAQVTDYKDKLKMIKCSLKPSAIGLGSFRITSISPAYSRLRHLRQRQII